MVRIKRCKDVNVQALFKSLFVCLFVFCFSFFVLFCFVLFFVSVFVFVSFFVCFFLGHVVQPKVYLRNSRHTDALLQVLKKIIRFFQSIHREKFLSKCFHSVVIIIIMMMMMMMMINY